MLYKNEWFATDQRFVWNPWSVIDKTTLRETFKKSYWVMQERLSEFNTDAFAVCDSFNFDGGYFPKNVLPEHGLLQNDFDLDGNYMVTLLTENPKNGHIILNNDGSFTYSPNSNFNGIDSISYCVFDGYSLSRDNKAKFYIHGNTGINESLSEESFKISTYPNPCNDSFILESTIELSDIMLFNELGVKVFDIPNTDSSQTIDVSMLQSGNYIILAKLNNIIVSKKIVVL